MDLRRYRAGDLPALSRLFGETVRRVNIRDYTPAQAEAWAAGEADLLTRDDWFRRLYTLVAEIDGQIAGYGNVDGTGYLDHLFVRWDGPLRRPGGTLPGPGAGCRHRPRLQDGPAVFPPQGLPGGAGAAGAGAGAGAGKLCDAQGIAQIGDARKIRN